MFAILFLGSRLQLLEYVEPFRGTANSASVYTREVVKEALRLDAVSAIVSHDHSSGNPGPSAADKTLTTHPKKARALVDVSLLDHTVVVGREMVSFAEQGSL